MLEHPMITRINATGYPSKDIDPQEEKTKKVACKDVYGNVVFVGEDVWIHNGQVIPDDSLEDYLIEVLGFENKKAEVEDEL
ncbi:hypothetical protein HLK66_16375 [Niallia circulans]|uniref:YqaI family protein n=1 Tax=Niallia circulans TaxID=1397 RepID=UPI00148F96DB|nr:hypothetical protein [Niallia circulans]QJX63013.1 hypothetical protein HLK66_16015 [Niallia circulans]QJX63074.1 hypothetical protein HLK66_16375 [Niallia circulans]